MQQTSFSLSLIRSQSTQQREYSNSFFTNELIFDQLSSFLQISDLLKLCQVNKIIHNVIKQKCKNIILSHKMFLIPSKTPIHQMRFYFDRCLTIYKKKDNEQNSTNINKNKNDNKKQKQKNKQQLQDKQTNHNNNNNNNNNYNYTLIRTIQNPFKYKTITYFQVGVVFTVCLTIDNQAFIYKTSKIINPLNQITKNDYKKLDNVIQIKTKSQHITYLKDNRQIYRLYGVKNNDQKIVQKQQLVEWSNHIQIQDIQASINYTVFKPKSLISYEQYCKFVLGYDIDLQHNKQISKEQIQNSNQYNNNNNENQKQSKTTLILYNNITTKHNLIQFSKKLNFTQIAVGRGQAYFLTQIYQCYVCYFEQANNNIQNIQTNQSKIIKGRLFHYFQNKSIIKISSGYNFYIALQRQIYNVQKWSVQQVCKWLRQIGFQQYIKIFIVEKVNGKKLLTIDKNYMYNHLGITKLNMQQKFIMLLEEVVHNKNKIDTLYGWGKNQHGQLGSRNSNYIKQPQKIKITCIKQNQYIDSIFCQWFETFIRTQKGRIYKTINQKKKKNKQQQKKQQKKQKVIDYIDGKKTTILDYQSQDQQQYDHKHNHNKDKNNHKKKRKNTHDNMIVKRQNPTNHKKFQQQQKWVQCEQGKAFFIRAYKDIVFYIQCPSQKQFQPTKQKKLRTAKMLLNKIIWSFQPNVQQQYKIGYIDKDMGLIQVTIKQLRMFDYNQNRIKYIKKNQIIIWDRQNKIDHFN